MSVDCITRALPSSYLTILVDGDRLLWFSKYLVLTPRRGFGKWILVREDLQLYPTVP